MTEVLTMPFPAAWRDGLLTENYTGLARSEALMCQAMIEKLRHGGYAVVGLAAGAQPRPANADTSMVLDFVVTLERDQL